MNKTTKTIGIIFWIFATILILSLMIFGIIWATKEEPYIVPENRPIERPYPTSRTTKFYVEVSKITVSPQPRMPYEFQLKLNRFSELNLIVDERNTIYNELDDYLIGHLKGNFKGEIPNESFKVTEETDYMGNTILEVDLDKITILEFSPF